MSNLKEQESSTGRLDWRHGCLIFVSLWFVVTLFTGSSEEKSPSPKPSPRSAESVRKTESDEKQATAKPVSESNATFFWKVYETPSTPVDAVVAVRDTSVFDSVGGRRIGKLRTGHAVKYSGEAGDFFEVYVVSGEPRYLKKGDAKRESVLPIPPNDETRCRAVFNKIIEAETRSDTAGNSFSDFAEGIAAERVLRDEYSLEIASETNISPAVLESIGLLGALEKWPPLYR